MNIRIRFFSHLGSGPYNNRSGGRISTYENNADKRAGTWGGDYQAHSNYEKLYWLIYFRQNSTTYNKNNDFMLYFYYDSKGTF